jgi:hypothetical protein
MKTISMFFGIVLDFLCWISTKARAKKGKSVHPYVTCAQVVQCLKRSRINNRSTR